MVTKANLTNEELHWLKQLSQHSGSMIPVSTADRLKELGLAEDKLGGTGISKAGKRLLMTGKSTR